MKRLVYIFFCLNCFYVIALRSQETRQSKSATKQEAIALLQAAGKWYESTPTYSFSVTHTMYAGHSTLVPYEQKKGYYKKYPSGSISYTIDLLKIQNANYSVTIDSARKIIIVSDPPKKFGGNQVPMEDYMSALDKCTNIKLFDAGNTTLLRLEFGNGSPVTAYEFTFNKDKTFQKVIAYYAKEVKSLQGTMVKPKLGITFESYKVGIMPAKNELDETKVISVNKNDIQLKEVYKEYQLIDQRLKRTNYK